MNAALPRHHVPRPRLGGGLPPGQRLLVLARVLPAGLELLRDRGAAFVGALDLAFTSDEVATLCRRAFGVELGPAEADALRRSTAGWAAPPGARASTARS